MSSRTPNSIPRDAPPESEWLTLGEAARRFKVDGRSVHHTTLLRWSTQGRSGGKLQTWLIGVRRVTTRKALEDFFDAQNR